MAAETRRDELKNQAIIKNHIIISGEWGLTPVNYYYITRKNNYKIIPNWLASDAALGPGCFSALSTVLTSLPCLWPTVSGPPVGPLYDFSGSFSSPRLVYHSFFFGSNDTPQSELAAMW